MNKNYYAILGVLPSAEDFVIRAAYRALAQRYHPDKSPAYRAAAEARMREINEAWAVLSNEHSRARYDRDASSGCTTVSSRAGEDTAPGARRPLPQNDALVVANRLRLNETFGFGQAARATRAPAPAVQHISEFA